MRALSIIIMLLIAFPGKSQDSLAVAVDSAHLGTIKIHAAPKNLQLSHIEIQEQFIDFTQLQDPEYRRQVTFGDALLESFDSLVPFYHYPKTMQLPHYLNDLTFHFAAIEWKSPHKIKYSYYLEGFEKNWTPPSTDAKAIYQNLPYGSYTLHIKAKGEASGWTAPFRYSFSIQRPWWHSSWAYAAYACVLIAIGLFLYRHIEQRKVQATEMERLLEENRLLAFSNRVRKKAKPSARERNFLDQVHQTLEAHLSDENFGIAELCEVLNISRAQLHRKLKRSTGQSTSHYIRSLRLDIAKGLLERTNLNVSEVAFRVGFSSAPYFSKVFKEEFGYAPKEWKG